MFSIPRACLDPAQRLEREREDLVREIKQRLLSRFQGDGLSLTPPRMPAPGRSSTTSPQLQVGKERQVFEVGWTGGAACPQGRGRPRCCFLYPVGH